MDAVTDCDKSAARGSFSRGDSEEGADMGKPRQDWCSRPGWDDPAWLSTERQGAPVCGGLSSEWPLSTGPPSDRSSGYEHGTDASDIRTAVEYGFARSPVTLQP